MPILDLSPLDAQGIRYGRPGHEVKWRKLTNVAFRDGSIVPRPGFKSAYAFNSGHVDDAAVEPKPVVALAEIWNPGSSAGSRGAGEWVTEIIRPDGSASIVAGWTASASTLHGDVDEVLPDGAYATATTIGASAYWTFANPSATYTDDQILGVRIGIRARVEYNAGDSFARLRLSARHSTTGDLTTIDTFDVWAFQVNETDFWYDYSFLMEKDYARDIAWTDSNLDNLQVALTTVDMSSSSHFTLAPTSLVVSTGWTDAVDGGAAAVGDITLTTETSPSELPDANFYSTTSYVAPKGGNGLLSAAVDSTLEVGFEDVDASTEANIASVDLVGITFRVKTLDWIDVPYELYYSDGSTDTLVTSGVAQGDCHPYSQPINVTAELDPSDDSAWTVAKVEAMSWILITKGSAQLVVEYVSAYFEATVTAAEVQIEKIEAEILAPGVSNNNAKLAATNKSFVRYDPEDAALTDVTNSVASQSYPSTTALDHATLYGQVYMVNGVDPTKRYPNGSSLFESLTTNNADAATAITGRTVCAFADRILYGWVKDNTSYIPERVAYSEEFDGGAHTVAGGGGDFDIIDSPGGVVALRPLNESVCFAGKQIGVYALRRTGNSAYPIIVDPVDYETQCLALHTAQRVLLKGKPVILFLGANPTSGLNVFAFDGTNVQPVGDDINPALEALLNPITIGTTLSAVDPKTGTYILFLSEGRKIDRRVGLAMNLTTGAWTQWDMTGTVYSTGLWQYPPPTTLRDEADGVSFPALPTLVLGGEDNLARVAHDLPYDQITVPQVGSTIAAGGFSTGGDVRPEQRELFTATLETGDIQFAGERGETQIMVSRLHLDYVDLGPVRILYSHSLDGGLTWATDTEDFIGTVAKDGSRQHAFLDFAEGTFSHERKVRFRIQVAPADSTYDLPYSWQIDRIFVEYREGAVDGP